MPSYQPFRELVKSKRQGGPNPQGDFESFMKAGPVPDPDPMPPGPEDYAEMPEGGDVPDGMPPEGAGPEGGANPEEAYAAIIQILSAFDPETAMAILQAVAEDVAGAAQGEASEEMPPEAAGGMPPAGGAPPMPGPGA